MALLKDTKCLPFSMPSVGDRDKYRKLFQNRSFFFCHIHAGALKMALFSTLCAHRYWQVLNVLCPDIEESVLFSIGENACATALR